MKKRTLFLIIGGLIVFVCLACLGLSLIIGSSPTVKATTTAEAVARATEAAKSSDTPKPTIAPTKMPVPAAPTCAKILSSKRAMTDAQWNDYKESLKGMWVVDWTGNVNGVSEGGLGLFASGYAMDISGDGGCKVLFTISDKDTALKYSKGQKATFTGQIDYFGEVFGFVVYLKANPVISEGIKTTILAPTVTPIALTYEAFYKNYQSMTDLQKEQYKSDFVGTRVHWTAKVEDVSEKGRIHFQGFDGYFYIWVYLDGVPMDKIKNINKNQLVEFEAIVRETGTGKLGVGFAVYLDNPTVFSTK